MTIPSATNIKQGKFSTSVNLFAVQMIHTSQNYNTNFQFTGLRANSVYSFFYFSTVEDPSIAALSSSVSVTSALTLQMLIIDINWEWRSAMVVLLCLFFVVMWSMIFYKIMLNNQLTILDQLFRMVGILLIFFFLFACRLLPIDYSMLSSPPYPSTLYD